MSWWRSHHSPSGCGKCRSNETYHLLRNPRPLDYDDSSWAIRDDLTQWHSRGFTFAWYRITVTLPETVHGTAIRGARCLFETCIDDYGEIWINGVCDRERGAIQGFNVPQRVLITTDPTTGAKIYHRLAGWQWAVGRAWRRHLCALCHAGV